MEIKKRICLILILVVICIMAFIFVLAKLVKENNQCMENLFVYGANTIVDNKGEIVYTLCFCPVGESGFYFDKDGMYKENPNLKHSSQLFLP